MTENRNMVPADGERRLTAAERANMEAAHELKMLVADRLDRIEQAMDTHIGPWLDQSGVSRQVFIASLRLAMAKNPAVARCTPVSLMLACMDSAKIALPPDGKKAAIVPFKGEATFVPMRDGIVDVMGRAGFLVSAQVIYEGEDTEDRLDYDLGSNPFVRFKPPLNRDDTAKVIAAFAVVTAKDGNGKWVELCSEKDLAKISRMSKTDKVRKEWPGEMHRKAPLRRVAKFLPSTPELELLNSIEAKAYHAAPVIEAKRKLSDDELLDDTAGHGPLIEGGGAPVAEEDDEAEMSPIHRFTEMLSKAPDVETLEERAAYVLVLPDYEALPPEEKAVFDMTLRMQRQTFGTDPEGSVVGAVEELTPTVDRFVMIAQKSAKELAFQTGAEWQAEMMATLSAHEAATLHFWWEQNLPHVRAAAELSRDHAERILMVAQGKGLDGAGEALDEVMRQGSASHG